MQTVWKKNPRNAKVNLQLSATEKIQPEKEMAVETGISTLEKRNSQCKNSLPVSETITLKREGGKV